MFSEEIKKLESLEPLIEFVNDQKITAMSKFLYERLLNPDSYLVFLGETSSGKSTIINGLLNETILPVKASPSTAAITEVELTEKVDNKMYYAINNNATIEVLEEDLFRKLCEHPDENLKRLKLQKNLGVKNLNNLRIFDTPGYGSVVKEHEEVLKEFLPNSDIIVYTVNYRIGIQEEDYAFLGFLRELVRDDVEIILLINRCPLNVKENDVRIMEIRQYIRDILSIEPKYFCIENIQPNEGEQYVLLKCPELWNYISEILIGSKRIDCLRTAFNSYIYELYSKCDSIINVKYSSAKMSEDELNSIIDLQKKTAERIRNAIPELIKPAFDKIKEIMPRKFDETETLIYERLNREIDNTNTAKMDEMIAYTNAHLLPYVIQQEGSAIQNYIELKLTELNSKVDDYISKEVINFNTELSVKLSSNTELAAKNVAAKVIQKMTTSGLGKYFAMFGGAGGSNAGIANAASHLLKKIGDLFGKKFSRETHNALKHFLAKIGATSMKAVSCVITVVVEVIMLVVDYSTWKGKLKKQIKKGLQNWKEETLTSVIKDLGELENDNIQIVNEIADEFDNCFEKETNKDSDELFKYVKLSEEIGEKIGA